MAVTWNSADASSGGVVLSNGNLSVAIVATAPSEVRATAGKSAGKWYWEISVDNYTSGWSTGIALGTSTLSNAVGLFTESWGYYGSTGVYYVLHNGATITSSAPAIASGMKVGVALDLDNLKVWFSKNGTWLSGDPSTNTGGNTISAGTWFPAQTSRQSTADSTANFGATAFAATLPTGFAAYDNTGTVQHLAANAQTLATSAAVLDLQHHLGAASQSIASATAGARVARHLSAAAQSIAAASAAARDSKHLAATAVASALSSADLDAAPLGTKHLSAAALGRVFSTAALDLQKHLGAAANAVSNAFAGIDVPGHLSAAAGAIAGAYASIEVLHNGVPVVGTPTDPGSFFLLPDGSYFLLPDSSFLLLQGQVLDDRPAANRLLTIDMVVDFDGFYLPRHPRKNPAPSYHARYMN